MINFKRPNLVGFSLIAVGVVTTVVGFSPQMSSTRTDFEDQLSWCVWGIGISLIGVGVMILIARPVHPIALILMAIVSPFAAFTLWVVVFWGSILLGPRGLTQSVFVKTGYSQISEAKQIDDLLGPGWHMVSNFKDGNNAQWITETLFGGRYELVMFEDIEFDQQGVTKILNSPKFMLHEISSVDGGGGVHFGRTYDFGPDEWRKVVAANGDFSVIGIQLQLNNPVPGFSEYQKQPRNGIQLKDGKMPLDAD